MDMKKILEALDGASTKPVEGSNDMKKFLGIVTEGTNPHKVSLPVQMAMQHYQKSSITSTKNSLLKKYFVEAEEKVLQESADRKDRLNKKAKQIADRIAEKNKRM